MYTHLAALLVAASLATGSARDVAQGTPHRQLKQKNNLSEREILESFFHETGGQGWTKATDWINSDNVCEWHGISCQSGMVTRIILPDNNLIGTVPPELFLLPELRIVNFNNNVDLMLSRSNSTTIGGAKRQGGRTGLGYATVLDVLRLENTAVGRSKFDLSQNKAPPSSFVPLDGIQDAQSLSAIYLSHNNFGGAEVPSSIFQLTNLKTLHISDCNFSSNMMHLYQPNFSEGFATKLEVLDCSKNNIHGPIPNTVIRRMTALISLNLSDNPFTGTLPAGALSQLTNLERLYIDRTIPESSKFEFSSDAMETIWAEKRGGVRGRLPDFSRLTKLREVSLASNSLYGTIPPNLLGGVNDKTRHVRIDLSSNLLRGGLPSELTGRFENLNIDLTNNLMLGGIDFTEVCKKTSWMGGEVSKFKCDAVLCPRGTFNEHGRQTNPSTPCRACEHGAAPYLGSRTCSVPTSSEQMRKWKEREILMKLYDSTNGKNWVHQDNWMDPSKDICSWYGVRCAVNDSTVTDIGGDETHMESHFVTEINLASNHLEGVAPSMIFALSSITSIDLSNNAIDISFYRLSEATKLQHLRLDSTQVSSLYGIGEASESLTGLKLSYARLAGRIPDGLFHLVNLKHLSLNNNALTGELSDEIGNLFHLQHFSCNENRLEGELPSTIGNLRHLEVLSLSENDFTGTLPQELGKLERLESLSIHHLNKEGTGLNGTLPDLSTNPHLRDVVLSGNSFHGTIPTSFLKSLNAVNARVTIDLRWNFLQGTVPSELGRLEQLDLWLAGNQFTDIAPELCHKKMWMGGTVGKYGCDAIVCPSGSHSAIGRQEDDQSPCLQCSVANVAPYLGSSECVQIQKEVDRSALVEIFHAVGGAGWTHNENWLTDSTDICTWYGITCKNGLVYKLDLRRNKLAGTIPESVYNLHALQHLDLSQNDVVIQFHGISKATELMHLNLDATSLTSQRGISQAQSLESLSLSGNNLKSEGISSEIFELGNLRSLSISESSLGGPLSYNIGNLVKLETLNLYGNDLTGPIPESIGSLTNLVKLTLSGNEFTGSLPDSMNALTNLETLYLERGTFDGEGLTGPLPDFIEHTNLTDIHLGMNRFEGRIPSSFLGGLEATQHVRVDLRWNQLTGSLPIQMTRFDKLDLYIAGNYIDQLDKKFCGKDEWMKGAVGTFGCDAIACPAGTSNQLGRQMSETTPCLECGVSQMSPFVGSTSCVNRENYQADERSILKSFYESVGGQGWLRRDNWLDDSANICSWYGIDCIGSKVTSINLDSNGLTGVMPSELFSLPSLAKLNLGDNKIKVSFDGIHKATSLEHLNLYSTGLTNVKCLGKASELTVLHLEQNNLDGTFPLDLLELRKLRELYLFRNNLSGTLPSELKFLGGLETLFLNGNSFTGQIPNSMGTLTNLVVLTLAENSFTGTLPGSILNLSELKEFSVKDQISGGGDGIGGNLPDFSSNYVLTRLYLSQNNLAGTIPPTFLGTSDTSSFINVDLSSNHLMGTIPEHLVKFDRLNLILTDNEIESVPSALCKKKNWMNGAVGDFGCDAILCPAGTYNEIGRQEKEQRHCKACSDETASTRYMGSVQCLEEERAKDRSILEKLFHACGGPGWKRRDWWLERGTDFCDWYGISCDEAGGIKSIKMGANNLQGTPPADLFELPRLVELDLHSNPISFSFEGIGRARALKALHLDSTGLESLQGIENATKLRELSCRFNRIKEIREEDLSELYYLEALLLSNNHIEGTLPASLDQLSRLRILRLDSNRFSGPIEDLSNMARLKYLDLSSNYLTGEIPPSFLGSLDPSWAIFVDLSSNRISGGVPVELARLQRLSLHLRNNQIDALPAALCLVKTWNNDDVGTYGCNGILCPVGTYNEIGRQSTDETECRKCNNANGARFYGSTECRVASGAERRQGWRSALLFFVTCLSVLVLLVASVF